MITFEGLGGNGEVWVGWVPGPARVNPSIVGAYCSYTEDISPVIPCAMLLPPVAAPGIWFDTRFTRFGGRVTKIDVGTIHSVDGNFEDPNPCDQSTITGVCASLGPGPNTFATHRIEVMQDTDMGGRPRYLRDGRRVSFLSGSSAGTTTPRKAYDELGRLVSFTANLDNQSMWLNTNVYYASTIPASVSSPTRPYDLSSVGQVLWRVPPTLAMTTATRSLQHSWIHTSANVWEEVWVEEYHQNASYLPLMPLSKTTGYGYVRASITRKRVHTLTFVQQKAPGDFRGIFSCVETRSYWGRDWGGTSKPLIAVDNEVFEYTYNVSLEVFSPGLCAKDTLDVSYLDLYCLSAIDRAKVLYREADMTTARTNAVADVKGLESNWIENLSQVGGTLEVVRPLLDGYKAVKQGDLKAGARAIAGAYLAYKYAIAPTISDYHDVHDNLKTTVRNITKYRFSNERRRGSFFRKQPVLDVTASLSYHCELNFVLKDNAFAKVFNALERLGLDPSPRNYWDLIPLSFVVDWFFKIGPALNRISLYTSSVAIRNLKSRIQSFKVQWPISGVEGKLLLPAASIKIIGDLSYSWYDRRISDRIGSVDPFAGQSFDGLSVSQTAQGAALLSHYLR